MSDQALPPGSLIGGEYVVDYVLGSGGFGITYAAHQRSLEENRVAVKEYFPARAQRAADGGVILPVSERDRAEFAAFAERFRTEAKSLLTLSNKLRNRDLVRFIQFIEAHDTYYIVMELLSGEALDQHVARTGVMSIEAVRNTMCLLLQTLQQVHNNRVLHRDIKPANVLLATVEGTPRPMLIDFGIATQTDDSGISDDSGRRDIAESESYSPPEHRERASAVSDLYSLAAVAFYCLTGRDPMPARDRLLRDDAGFDIYKLLPPDTGPELSEFILKCLERDPARRIPSAELALRLLRPPPRKQDWLATLPEGALRKTLTRARDNEARNARAAAWSWAPALAGPAWFFGYGAGVLSWKLLAIDVVTAIGLFTPYAPVAIVVFAAWRIWLGLFGARLLLNALHEKFRVAVEQGGISLTMLANTWRPALAISKCWPAALSAVGAVVLGALLSALEGIDRSNLAAIAEVVLNRLQENPAGVTLPITDPATLTHALPTEAIPGIAAVTLQGAHIIVRLGATSAANGKSLRFLYSGGEPPYRCENWDVPSRLLPDQCAAVTSR